MQKSSCSSPGKVFVVGGYVVLEKNDGLVFETSCRITSITEWVVYSLYY